MTQALLRRILWKEYRTYRGFWIAMVILALAMQFFFVYAHRVTSGRPVETEALGFLALGMTVSDAGAGIANWIDTTYFSASADQIRKLTLENKNGRFEFEKDEAGSWTMINLPPGETLLENNVTSLVTRISSHRW